MRLKDDYEKLTNGEPRERSYATSAEPTVTLNQKNGAHENALTLSGEPRALLTNPTVEQAPNTDEGGEPRERSYPKEGSPGNAQARGTARVAAPRNPTNRIPRSSTKYSDPHVSPIYSDQNKYLYHPIVRGVSPPSPGWSDLGFYK